MTTLKYYKNFLKREGTQRTFEEIYKNHEVYSLVNMLNETGNVNITHDKYKDKKYYVYLLLNKIKNMDS